MKITKKIKIEQVVGYRCDICKKDCESTYESEHATLQASWGYMSNKDLETHECHMCESCYDKVRLYIEQTLGGEVIIDDGKCI